MSEFIDVILGKCKFKDRFYVTNHFYGGYAYDCEEGFGNVSYADPNTVIDLAEASKMTVHLAGASWKAIGREGFGEVVSVEEARKLVEELRAKKRT